jgi:hypothetical protein
MRIVIVISISGTSSVLLRLARVVDGVKQGAIPSGQSRGGVPWPNNSRMLALAPPYPRNRIATTAVCDCRFERSALLLYRQHESDAQIHVPQQVRREPTDPIPQQPLVDRDQLRHVDDRISAQAAGTCADPNVAGRPLEAEVGTYDRTDDRANRAFIEVIRLNNE